MVCSSCRMMRRVLWFGLVLAVLCLALAACGGRTESLTEEQVLDAAWEDLEPHTSSHDRDAWEVVEIKQVEGREVDDVFEREQPRCVWPTPLPNDTIQSTAEYWYVELRPRPATPLPGAEISPTAPPNIPEPFVRDAFFLIDPTDGTVEARMLFCVVY